jgi:hypothetical protein
MAYDPTTQRTTSENCAEHRWPRYQPGGSMRSIGTVTYEQCNNCLAMRVVFTTDLKIDGKWHRVSETKIVEPNFDLSKAVSHDELFKKE